MEQKAQRELLVKLHEGAKIERADAPPPAEAAKDAGKDAAKTGKDAVKTEKK